MPRTPRNDMKWSLQRRGELYDRYLAGETLQEIGTDIGLTRERVRQIIAPLNPDAAQAKIAEKRRKFLAVAEANPDVTTYELAELANVAHSYVLNHLPAGNAQIRAAKSRVDVSSAPWVVHADKYEKAKDIKRVADRLGEKTISLMRYNEHRTAGMFAGIYFHQTFGSWEAACHAAGIEMVRLRPLDTYEKTYSDETLWTWTMVFLEKERIPSYSRFVKWCKENKQYGCPSAITVRVRLGRMQDKTWIEIKNEAFAMLDTIKEMK